MEKLVILREKCFIAEHSIIVTVLKCPEKRAPAAKGRESQKSKKKEKRKSDGIHSIEEMETMVEPVDKAPWSMFTVIDSQGRCKEMILPY